MPILLRRLVPTALAIDAGTPTALPVPTATETDVVVQGFSVNARIHPQGRPAKWRVQYGATSSYGTTTADRALPGRLAAHYAESWAEGLNAWRGSINGDRLVHQASGGYGGGAFVRYTDEGDSNGNDSNHLDGVGMIHLPLYLHCGFADGGAGVPTCRLGGMDPDLRGAHFSARVKSADWDGAGTTLNTWIQVDENTDKADPTPIRRPNWAHTGVDHTAAIQAATDWTLREWTLRNRTQDWTYAGRNDSSPPGTERYWYGELDKTLSNVNVDFFLFQCINVDWLDDPEYPSGSIDVDEFHVVYRQHNVCATSNGGTLISSPAGGTGTAFLTDGWRNGVGREWQSAENPSSPQSFVYAFDNPITLMTLLIHNSVENPSEEIAIDVSENGTDWTEVSTGTLPETSEYGPNFVFHHDHAFDNDTAERLPLYADPITHLRVRILSGYSSSRWGLGEIEAFGPGAEEETDDDWYDVNQDIQVGPGTYHYRVVAEDADGNITYGPDQTVVVS